MNKLLETYKPEIIATFLLLAYTVVRTLVVAYGISPVSDADWVTFLWIELITTLPYVWAMGVIIRVSYAARATRKVKKRSRQQWIAICVAIITLLAPYAYLAAYGALTSLQGIYVFIGLLVVFTLPSIVRFIYRIRHRSQT